jgi:class 3 adenylate cyclase/tetratricopeptide (TPR) repeat protein
VICPVCHAPNKDGARFCKECGTPLALRCGSCGASHEAGQKFCDECGAALAAARSTSAVPEVPAAAPAVNEPAGVAEMRLVSVLFVDLVGFTSLSEGRDAEDVRELLGRYFEQASTIVGRYGGTIEKFIGDAVMAVWGAPVAREDDAERAVRAALEIVDAVSVFGGEVGAPDLRARAGVVTGQVAALENPGEGLVVGDRVNTASRVQSAAQPGAVFVDEVTRGVTSAAIAYEDGGEHTVKGKSEPLRLWRAVRVVAGVGGAQREEGIAAAFVGRGGELRLLKELFHGALERRSARLVAVTGEAGVGKSRLLREFSNYTDGLAETVLWHSGRCLSYGDGVAYWALGEMVRQRLGIPEDAASEEARAKLDAGLERWVPDPADRAFVAPRLGALLGLAEPGLGRAELFAGWRMFFERLAGHEPVVLVFEDLQWADEGLLEFIGQLLDWSARSPIFVLTLARPELGARHQGWPAGLRSATLLPLDPLEDAAISDLLGSVVEDLPRAATELIVAQAEGIPLYAVETVRSLTDRGVLSVRDGRLMLVGEMGELDVPASLGSLLAARIDGLEPAERQLVKAMSVFGGSFPSGSAVALAGLDGEAVDEMLNGLVRKQVFAIRSDPLSPDRGQYAFAQGLFRTVAYEMLSRQERKTRHLAAASHLRAAFPNDGEEVAEAIAIHLLDAYRAAGQDPDADDICQRVVIALQRSAERAGTIGSPEAGSSTLLTARELVRDPDERVALADGAAEMAVQAGRWETALTLFDEVAAAHEAAGRERDAARAITRIELCLRRLGRNEEAITRIGAALEVLDADALDPVVGELNFALAASLVWSGQLEPAEPTIERALRVAEHLQLPELLADAFNTKALLRWRGDRIREALVLYRAAIEIAGEHDLSAPLALGYANLGAISHQWDLPGSEAALERALGLSRRQGNRYLEALALVNLGVLRLVQGRWDEVAETSEGFLDPDRPRAEDSLVWSTLALLHARRGQPDRAQRALEQLSDWRESDDLDDRTTYAAVAFIIDLTSGNPEPALAAALAAQPDAVAGGGGGADAVRIGWADTVRGAITLGRLDDARSLITLLTVLAPGRVPPYMRAHLTLANARLAVAEGRDDDIETNLQTAIGAFTALAYPYDQALAQTELASWLTAENRAQEAEAPLVDAIATFASLGARPDLERARAILPAVADPTPLKV